MDKRFFLFLIIAAIILVVTPKLFPPASPPRAAKPAPTSPQDSVATAAVPEMNRTAAPSAPVPAPPVTAESLNVLTAKPETVTVTTPKAVYQFSTLGAAPIGTMLRDYKALSAGDGNVQLARPGIPLLEYRLLHGRGDTLHLERVPFAVDSSRLNAAAAPAVTFRTSQQGTTVAITYTFAPDSYLVHVTGRVESTNGARDSRYLLLSLPRGLHSAEADTVDDQRNLAYVVKPARGDVQSISFGKLDTPEPHVESGPLTWVASRNKYFVLALLTDTAGTPFSGAMLRGLPHQAKLVTSADAVTLQQIGADGAFTFDLYTGPQEWRRLHALGRDMENVNPYGHVFRGIVQPFATIVMRILLWMHDQTRINYGWVLIIFGVVVRLILWPLNQSAMRSSLRLQRLQPELQALQRKYKTNPEKLQTEMMRLYREHGMSPFSPLAGCLPMLIPMPVLFALFFVFQNTIEFRGVSFLWLADISQKDPYYILPIVMGISMYLLSWIGLRSSPPNPQTKMMNYVLPVVMTMFFLNLASGLNLYYAVQNIAALPQQWLIARERAKAGPPPKPARA